MNIGIGKFGKSILFDSKKWGAIGGDLDAPVMISLVAKRHPEHNFYLLGHSDFSRLKPEVKLQLAPNGNIIDCWQGHKGEPYTFRLLQYFEEKGIKLDCAFLHNGPCGNANVPDTIKVVDGDEIAKTLFCFRKYSGPMIHLLNKTGLPWMSVSVDSRYTPLMARDLFNQPRFSISQVNKRDRKRKIIRSYEDQSYVMVSNEHVYSGIETLFLTMKKKPDPDSYCQKKNTMMTVILNEGGNGAWKRGPILAEYVLNNPSLTDVNVYGKWSSPWCDDPRFKGPKQFSELEPILNDTRYTFIIPIERGWVTAKFWEMIHYGIVPFMHPTYDEEHNLKCPEFIRVKDPADLQRKIEILESNYQVYNSVLGELHEMLEDKYYDGSHIDNVVTEGINKLTRRSD